MPDDVTVLFDLIYADDLLFLQSDMKKIVLVLLAALYLLSAVGVSAEHFYCCGKLAGTTFSFGDSGHPVVKASVKAENCCKTTQQSFKVKDNHVGAAASPIAPMAWIAVLTQPKPALSEPMVQENRAVIYQPHGPPNRQQIPIYILNSTYRI